MNAINKIRFRVEYEKEQTDDPNVIKLCNSVLEIIKKDDEEYDRGQAEQYAPK